MLCLRKKDVETALIWYLNIWHDSHRPLGQDCGALKIPTLWTAAFGESPEVEIKVPLHRCSFATGMLVVVSYQTFFCWKPMKLKKLQVGFVWICNEILSIAKRCSNCIYYSSVLVYLNVFPWWVLDNSRVAYMAGILVSTHRMNSFQQSWLEAGIHGKRAWRYRLGASTFVGWYTDIYGYGIGILYV